MGKAIRLIVIDPLCNVLVYKWENAYSRDLNAWGILINFYLFIKVKSGDALVYVYVLEHIVSLNYRIAWWVFNRLGRDKVLKNLYWLSGQIRQGKDLGQGCNWTMRGPSPKDFFFRVGRLQQQTEYIAMIYKHLGRSVDICGSILTFSFWHVLVWCIGLSHFHFLPFKYFYGAKCLIYINLCTFHVKENGARLQWYSCAWYKAPGPLVFSSPEPKAQMSYCHSALSVVVLP